MDRYNYNFYNNKNNNKMHLCLKISSPKIKNPLKISIPIFILTIAQLLQPCCSLKKIQMATSNRLNYGQGITESQVQVKETAINNYVGRDDMIRKYEGQNNQFKVSNKYDKFASQYGLNYNIKGEINSINISIGTPQQYFKVLLDTGSDLFWITSATSKGCGGDDPSSQQINKFNSKNSQTFLPLNYPIQLHYVCCNIYGKSNQDIIKMVGFQVFWYVIVAQICSVENVGFDGVMGLGANKNVDNVIDVAYKQKKLVSSKFAFEMGRRQFNEPCYFYYNISAKEDFGNVLYEKVGDDWGFWLKQCRINYEKFPLNKVSIDTGSAHTFMHLTNFNKIYQKHFQQYCRIFPIKVYFRTILCQCNDMSIYPYITLQGSNLKITLTPLSYLQYTNVSGVCQLAMDGMDLTGFEDRIVIGGRFYQIFTVVHDKENQKIGFVKTKREEQKQKQKQNETNNGNSVMIEYADNGIFEIFWIVVAVLVGVIVWVMWKGFKNRDGSGRQSQLRNNLNNSENQNEIYNESGNRKIEQTSLHESTEFKQMGEIQKRSNLIETNV